VSGSLLGVVVRVRKRPACGSALEGAAELAAELAIEVHEAAESEEPLDVLVALEGSEHAGEVVG
jgi:hypothetical protein